MIKNILLFAISIAFLGCGESVIEKNNNNQSLDKFGVLDCKEFHQISSYESFFENFQKQTFLNWIEGPVVGLKKKNKVMLNFKALHEENLKIEKICFYNFMSVHGHGGGSDAQVSKIDGHKMELSGFTFTMSGPWELELRVLANGRYFSASIPVSL